MIYGVGLSGVPAIPDASVGLSILHQMKIITGVWCKRCDHGIGIEHKRKAICSKISGVVSRGNIVMSDMPGAFVMELAYMIVQRCSICSGG